MNVLQVVVKEFIVLFGVAETLVNFVLADDSPVDVFIGYQALDIIQACIDTGNNTVTVTAGEKKSVLDLEYDELLMMCKNPEPTMRISNQYSEIYQAASISESNDDKELVVTLATTICKIDDEETIPQIWESYE